MSQRRVLAIIVIACCVLFTGWIVRADVNSRQRQAEFTSVASVGGLMGGHGILFKELIMSHQGKNKNYPPGMTSRLAESLAELANVNRLNRPEKDFQNKATTLRDLSLELAKELAKEKDADITQVGKLLGQIKSACTACHDVYQQG